MPCSLALVVRRGWRAARESVPRDKDTAMRTMLGRFF